ncbi:hypothetical protein HPB47_012035 [Ixodes persulcatus]|uniref:Uncharacterized protein n=1 Tax=Ixodes persulcatus TaxID=34615 RepID=A0AC60NUL5_IXOPE|nr:hypothetical protein HPB47_012035 [Ixodes persulcatus]
MDETHDSVVLFLQDGGSTIEFSVSRDVVSKSSSYLRDVIREFWGNQGIKLQFKNLSQVSSMVFHFQAAFEGLKTYLHHGVPSVTCHTVTDLYRIACKLRLQPLMTRCMKYLAEAGPVGRQLVLLCNAVRLGLQDEKQAALQFIVEQFDTATRSRQFLELDCTCVCMLLSSDVLSTASETGVLLAALTWLEHEYQGRRQFEDIVLGCIRFPLLPESILLKCMEPQPPGRAALQGAFVKTKLAEASFFHYVNLRGRPDLGPEIKRRTFLGTDPSPQSLDQDALQPGSYNRTVIERHILTEDRVKQALQRAQAACSEVFQTPTACINNAYYRKHERELTVAQATPNLLGASSFTDQQTPKNTPALGGKDQWDADPALQALPRMTNLQVPGTVILISGGLGADERISTSCSLLGFTPKDGILWRCGRLPQPRQLHASVFLDSYLYILGGFDVRNTNEGLRFATKTCFRLELSTGTWERLADMRHARCNHAAVAMEGRIYVVAGQDEFDITPKLNLKFDSSFLSSVEWYEPGSDAWTELALPLPCRLSACGVASFRGLLHVAGGLVQAARRRDLNVVSTLLRWDGHRWTTAGPNLPLGRGSLGLVEHAGKLYAVGGLARAKKGHLRVLADVLIYDSQKDDWMIGPSLPEPLHACRVASVDGRLMVMCGLRSPEDTSLPSSLFLQLNGNRWQTAARLPVPLAGCSTAVCRLQNSKTGTSFVTSSATTSESYLSIKCE